MSSVANRTGMSGTVPELTSVSRPMKCVFFYISRNKVYGTLNIIITESSEIFVSRNVPEKIDNYAESQGITHRRVGNASYE